MFSILTSLAVIALVLMLAFPETPTGKWLHRILVEPPARFFTDFTWAKLAKALLIGAAFVVLALMGPEMVLVLGASGLDAAALIEMMFIVWLAAASGSALGAWRKIKRIVIRVSSLAGRVFAPRNRSRAPRRRKQQLPKSDDKGEPGWAFA